jgi:hypothetical protein
VCVLCYPVNLLLSQNNNISLRGLRKIARRRAYALERAWRCFRYKDIDHIMKCEHECTLLRLPRTMVSTVIFPERQAGGHSNQSFFRTKSHPRPSHQTH